MAVSTFQAGDVRQLVPLDGVWIQPPYITTDETLLRPDINLLKAIKPVVAAVGLTELKQGFPYLRVYFEISSRISLLEKVSQMHEEFFSDVYKSFVESGVLETELNLDEYQSLIDKLGSELDFVYSMRDQLDNKCTIDHPLKEVVSDFYKMWSDYLTNNPAKVVRERYQFHKMPAFRDDATRVLKEISLKTRRGYQIQRLLSAVHQAHKAGWFMVMDTLTLDAERVKDFYDNPYALRNHFRKIGRKVLRAENRKISENYSDCFQYFCCPEYGEKEGRLHFHAIYLMRTLPVGTVDPNIGLPVRRLRQLPSLLGTWAYGNNTPYAVRYSEDAYTRAGWFWPVEKNGKPYKTNGWQAVAYYCSKYVSKKTEQDYIKLGIGGERWNKTLRDNLKEVPDRTFRVRTTRQFGLRLPSMAKLSQSSLLEMTRLHFKVSPLHFLLKKNARRELRSRLAKITIADLLATRPAPTNLLKSLRRLMRDTQGFNLLSFTDLLTPKLKDTDISDETRRYLEQNDLSSDKFKGLRERFGSK